MEGITIKGYLRTSLIDYPGKIVSLVFLPRCNFRCPFCFNVELANDSKSLKTVEPEEIFEHLKSQRKWLDGVCLSILGEEPVLIRQNGVTKNVPIEKLWNVCRRIISAHEGYEIQDCEKIEALTIEQHFLPVKNIVRHRAKHIYVITLSPGNYEISVTSNHSVFVLTKEGLIPKKISELSKNDYLVTPKKLNNHDSVRFIDILTYFKEELSDSKKEMLSRKRYWENIISSISNFGTSFVEASKTYCHERHTISKYFKAYKEKKLEEACYTGNPNLLWVKDNFLYVGYNKLLPVKLPLTKGLVEFLGYATAEGSYSKDDSYKFTLGNEPEFAKDILLLFQRIFKTKSGSIQTKNINGKNQYIVCVGGKYLALLISKLVGSSANNKKIPTEIFNTNSKNQRTFIFAVNKGDGHNRLRMKHRSEEFSIKTVSKQLASDLIILLRFFSMYALLTTENAKVKEQASYKIHFHGNQYQKLGLSRGLKLKYSYLTSIEGIPKELIGMTHLKAYREQNRINIDDVPPKYQNPNKVFNIAKNWNILKVKSVIKKSVNNLYVYDLVVPGDNSFLGGLGLILLHNTGGEPTLHSGLPEFIKEIKKLGFLVKLDTNGTNPEMLEELIKNKLIDYVAMDIKGPLEKYKEITGSEVDKKIIQKSVDIIRNSGIDYEFRTTIVPRFHSKEDVLAIGKWLKGSKKYCLQQFRNEKTLDKKFENERVYTPDELKGLAESVKEFFDTVEVRGI